jgi:hypothetical protein
MNFFNQYGKTTFSLFFSLQTENVRIVRHLGYYRGWYIS